MPGTVERSLPTQTADSYNLFLFHKRTALGLGMRAFARKLGIGWFRYRLIENGYIKPSARDVKKISAALEMDYATLLLYFLAFTGVLSLLIHL